MKRRTVWGLLCCALSSATIIACDSDDGPKGIAADTGGSAETTATTTATVEDTSVEDTAVADTDEPDTTVEVDTNVPVDTVTNTAADTSTPEDTTTAEDTSSPVDTTTPEVTPGCGECLVVGAGPTDMTLTMAPANLDPPNLTGTGAPELDPEFDQNGYEFDSVVVYTKGAFNGLLIQEATLSNNGESSGRVDFDGDVWGYFLDLDLHYVLDAGFLGQFDGDARESVGGGGCYSVAGVTISSETERCDSGWPDGAEPPSTFQYELGDGTLKLRITLTREFILALIPEEQRTLAESAVTGPITFIASLTANTPL